MIDNFIQIINYPHFWLFASLLFFLLSFNPVNLLATWKLYQHLERGESLPERLDNFPVQQTSMQDYLNVCEKIGNFKQEILRGNSYELVLNSSDINNLYLKGKSINKYNVNNLYGIVPLASKYCNKFLYFQLSNNAILRKRVEYFTMSSIGMPDGIITETLETRFKNKLDGVFKYGCVIEWNDKKMDSGEDWADSKFTSSILGSTLIKAILTGDFDPSVDTDINQENLITTIISKIRYVEVSNNNLLIIRT
jgi:hypothetical protein